MNALRRLSLDHRPLFLALVAMALAVRALVPGGWMVMPAADGAVRLTLCSGTGPVAFGDDARPVMAAMPGMAHHDERGGDAPTHGDHPCAFTGAGLASDLPVFDVPTPPMPIVEHVARGVGHAIAIGHGLAAPPPPPTGPPAFA